MNNKSKYNSFTKNPLGIIALSLIIVEAIAGLVIKFSTLPDVQNLLLIIFVIVFPFAVMSIFFILVTKHHSKLYSPSDFVNEENFITWTTYKPSENTQVTEQISISQIGELVDERLRETKESIKMIRNLVIHTQQIGNDNVMDNDGKSDYSISISESFGSGLRDVYIENGYYAEIYKSHNSSLTDVEDHQSIWIGRNVNLPFAKEVIKLAREWSSELIYLTISRDFNKNAPDYVNDQIFIGGSTNTALNTYKISAFTEKDFRKLDNSNTIEEFHKTIQSKY